MTANPQKQIALGPADVTYVVIKPHAYKRRDEMRADILNAGFRIEAERYPVWLARETAELLYAAHKNKPFYNTLLEMMTEGPTDHMIISGEDAINAFRRLVGPTDSSAAKKEAPDSLRSRYGLADPNRIELNAVHASDSPANVRRESSIFFSRRDLPQDVATLFLYPD